MLDPYGIMKVLTDKRDLYKQQEAEAMAKGSYYVANLNLAMRAAFELAIEEMAREIGVDEHGKPISEMAVEIGSLEEEPEE